MADLPELSDSTNRKLALRWSALREANGLVGDHLHWHQQERDRLKRIAAQSPGQGSDARGRLPKTHDARATDGVGIHSSVKLAEGRFNDLVAEYWPLWLASADGYDRFVGWLEALKRKVAEEIASIWRSRSKPVDRWYKRACAPAVENTLAALVKEGTARARGEELKRLEASTKAKDDAGKAEGGNGAAPISRFLNRASWLKERLLERGWSHSDPSKFGGPDRKSIEKIIRGEPVGNNVLEKLAKALSSQKLTKVTVFDIPQN
jgi:hypothetical protein